MNTSIKTWRERYQEDANCKPYGVAGEIQEYMQAEINDLREEVKILEDTQRILIERANEATQKVYEEKDINWKLKAQLQELNLQYISDFGQLQEREPVGTVASLFDEAAINHCGFNRDHLVYLSPKPKE